MQTANCKFSSKGYLTVVNYKFFSEVKKKLCNNCRFKSLNPQIFTSDVVYKFQFRLCNESYCGEWVRYLEIKNVEHIGLSTLTDKRVEHRKDSAVCNHLLNCNYSSTFEDFSLLCHKNKKHFLEPKESLSYNER